MKAIIGKKQEMTQIFKEDGTVVPVTLVKVEPCTVLEIRKHEGVNKVVVGFGAPKNLPKPQLHQWKEKGAFADVCEFILHDDEQINVGDILDASVFASGDLVNVVGQSKGRGFQGVVKRHGFHGSPATHGHKDQLRKSGSIGAAGIQRVFKGMRMPGRMGGDRVTVKNLEIIHIQDKNAIAVKGAIPGSRGSLVQIIGTNGNVWQK